MSVLPGSFYSSRHRHRSNSCLVLVLMLLTVSMLSACTRPNGRAQAESLARRDGFTPMRFATQDFVLKGWLRPAREPGRTLHVYIEGDGLAWLNRTTPSADPTPTVPVAFDLASSDPTLQAVLYLARPCQYTEGEDRRTCTPADWTSARFSPHILRAMHEALNMAKERTATDHLALYGFSGGGGIAALLAAQRDDVLFLGTVAGNLDHKAWTQHHRVTPLTASLNPYDHVAKTRAIPQIHVTGSQDDIVPSFMADAWCTALQDSPCTRRTISGAGHSGPWTGAWPALLHEKRPRLP